eukprot:3191910-Prymnesium_polylepis.1
MGADPRAVCCVLATMYLWNGPIRSRGKWRFELQPYGYFLGIFLPAFVAGAAAQVSAITTARHHFPHHCPSPPPPPLP